MDGVKCVIVIHEMGEIFMRVAIASDHGGYRLKERLKKYLKNKDIDCIDCGTVKILATILILHRKHAVLSKPKQSILRF